RLRRRPGEWAAPHQGPIAEDELRRTSDPQDLRDLALERRLLPRRAPAGKRVERGILDQDPTEPIGIDDAREADARDQAGALARSPADPDQQPLALSPHVLVTVEQALLRSVREAPFAGPFLPLVLQEERHA